MLSFITQSLKVQSLDTDVLEVAFELYLEAPQDSHPMINLRTVSERTGTSLLECRNAIVHACKTGRFPNCSLVS
ncbi:MAG TPA: hypothetical protein V6D29_24505 [Leptolyngbyaceae cyanobacterium]